MPTENEISGISLHDLLYTLHDVLSSRGKMGVAFAILEIYEIVAILAAKRANAPYASNQIVKRYCKYWGMVLCNARNVIAHNYYDKDEVIASIQTIYMDDAIYMSLREVIKFSQYPDIEKAVKEFTQYMKDVFSSNLESKPNPDLVYILNLIPPAVRDKYPSNPVEAALQFAAEQLSRL